MLMFTFEMEYGDIYVLFRASKWNEQDCWQRRRSFPKFVTKTMENWRRRRNLAKFATRMMQNKNKWLLCICQECFYGFFWSISTFPIVWVRACWSVFADLNVCMTCTGPNLRLNRLYAYFLVKWKWTIEIVILLDLIWSHLYQMRNNSKKN